MHRTGCWDREEREERAWQKNSCLGLLSNRAAAFGRGRLNGPSLPPPPAHGSCIISDLWTLPNPTVQLVRLSIDSLACPWSASAAVLDPPSVRCLRSPPRQPAWVRPRHRGAAADLRRRRRRKDAFDLRKTPRTRETDLFLRPVVQQLGRAHRQRVGRRSSRQVSL